MEILAAASAQETITKIDAIMAIGGDRRQAHAAINGLLEQELLVAEGNSKYVLAESVREKLSNQETKEADAPKHPPSTITVPYLYRTSTIPVSKKSFRYFIKVNAR